MQKISKNKGITLVSLIVTIIFLMILAGVVIATVTGNNGILGKAKQARDTYQNSENEEMKQLSEYEDYFKISSSRDIKSNSVIIGDFSISIIINSKNFISINVNNNYSKQTKGYIYFINDKVAGVSTNSEYTYTELTGSTDYVLYAVAIDNDGNMKKSNILNAKTNINLQSRYMLVDVYDHIGGDCAVINEIEFYDENNNIISYSCLDSYDSYNNGTSSYWNTSEWNKANLYDGDITYDSGITGSKSCACFYYPTNTMSGYYARFFIDFGTERNVTNIRVAIGNQDQRIPKEVSIYALMKDNYNAELKDISDYNLNLMWRKNDNLFLIHTEKFENIITKPIWYNFI